MIIKEINDEKVWEDFVQAYHPNNFLASWCWGDFNILMGSKVFRLGFYEKEDLAGCCLVIRVNSKMGDFLICPSGPLFKEFNLEHLKIFTDEIKKIAKNEKAHFVRVRPLIEGGKIGELFQKLGYRPSPTHVHAQVSWLLDISKPEEELLACMRKTTRYLVRQAGKLGVVVEEKNNIEGVALLENLQEQTAKRHHFTAFSNKYLEKEFEVFIKEEKVKLLIAKKGSEVLAVAMIVLYGDSAFYHHGASVESKVPASYLLQWEAIRLAKSLDKKFYNFWGIAPTDSPNHPWAGLTAFKQGFGGFRLEYAPSYDLPLSPFYPLIYLFERTRRFKRGLG